MFLGPLLDSLDHDLTCANIPIVHLKALIYTPTGSLKAAVCANGQEQIVEGALDASPSASHHLLLNLRAAAAPEPVQKIVERTLGHSISLRLRCFRPAAPEPEYRVTL